MFRILTNNYTFPSAKILRDALVELSGEKILVTSDPDKIPVGCKLIRYGNSSRVYGSEETNYNSGDLIEIAASKFRFAQLMSANNIYSPLYSRSNPPIFDKERPARFPLLIRESLTSSGGKGIHVVKSQEEFSKIWQSHFYWTLFLSLSFELRVHTINGKILRVFRKEERETSEYPIRNNSVCDFKLRSIEHYPKLEEFIKTLCVSPLNVGFFGADIGWDSNAKEYFVIEINSAPGLNENTAKAYAEEIWKNIK